MLNNYEIKDLKSNLKDYLYSKGINVNERKTFRCINPEHEDKNPSMGYKNNVVHCFACGKTYDLMGAIEVLENKDKKEAFKKAVELYGRPKLDYSVEKTNPSQPIQPTKNQTNENGYNNKKDNKNYERDFKVWREEYLIDDEAQAYIKFRGISEKTAENFKIGFSNFYIDNDNRFNGVVIPTSENSCFIRNIDSSATGNNKMRKYGKTNFLNVDALTNEIPYCFIVEGEFDCLSFYEIGINAVCLSSVSNINLFKKTKKDLSKTYILALDNDEAGKIATNDFIEYFKKEDIKFIQFDNVGYKDPNEALIRDRELLKQKAEEAILNASKIIAEKDEQVKVEYEKNSVSNNISKFRDYINDSKSQQAVSTGFKNFDFKLYGGLYEGLYFISAMPSVGKTTFMLQIADSISKSGNDVLYFSLEMSKFELMSKSISRISMERLNDNNIALSMRDVTNANRFKYVDNSMQEFIDECIDEYEQHSKHLYIVENNGELTVGKIRQYVKNHIKKTGNKPVVIIDYLQIIPSSNIKFSDKQNVDNDATFLKRISRDFRIPVAAISSLNRHGYKGEVKMESNKESGIIEYSADFLFGLNVRDKGDIAFKGSKEIYLTVIKNRNGEKGIDIDFEYFPKCNYFREKENSLIEYEMEKVSSQTYTYNKHLQKDSSLRGVKEDVF